MAIYGSLQGIRATHIKQVERLYETRFASDSFITREFAEQLASISHTIHHRGQLSTYLRPMGAKVPSIYGGSADEPFEMPAA